MQKKIFNFSLLKIDQSLCSLTVFLGLDQLKEGIFIIEP